MWGDNDAKKIDGGWIRGDDDDMKVTVMKGRAVLDLELMAPGAKGRVGRAHRAREGRGRAPVSGR